MKTRSPVVLRHHPSTRHSLPPLTTRQPSFRPSRPCRSFASTTSHLGSSASSSMQAVARRGPARQRRPQPRQLRRPTEQLGYDHPRQHFRSAQSFQQLPYHTRGLHQRQPRVQAQVGNTKTRPPVPDHETPRAHVLGQQLALPPRSRASRYQERAGPLRGTVWSDTPTTDDPRNAWFHDDTCCVQFRRTFPSEHTAKSKPVAIPMLASFVADSSRISATTSPLEALARAENRSMTPAALPWPGASEPQAPRLTRKPPFQP